MPEMTMHDFPDPQHDPSGSHAAQSLGDTLRWAFELDSSPAIAGAAFLTREIIPAAKDPFDAIIAASTTQHQLEDLKNAYKMLRTTGATAPERSLAARLYAATIAAALVRHGAMISRQNPFTLAKAFEEMSADPEMPERIRELGPLAIDAMGRIK
ncbi:MAG: hypothetical protein RLZZ116_720 [Planctomycetota bacterium]